MFLSNTNLQDPCVTHKHRGVTTVSCSGLPRTHLGKDGVVIEWFSESFPMSPKSFPLAHVPGVHASIDGHAARMNVTNATGTCSREGGTRQITATIWIGQTGRNYLDMIACLADPPDALTRQVLTSLGSVHD
jgi:hypothetical protein